MNKTSAILAFLGAGMPSPDDLKEIVIKAYIAHLKEADEARGDEETMGALISAYNAIDDAFLAEEDKDPRTLCSKDTAEKLFREYAIEGYREHFQNEPDDSEAFPWWPEYLPYRNNLYSSSLIREMGYLAGYHEGRRSKDMIAYFREQQEGKAEKDSKF